MSNNNTFITKAEKALQNCEDNSNSFREKAEKYLIVLISEQKIFLIERNKISFEADVSTSKYGIGHEEGSFKTPVGVHCISKKIGKDQPKYTVFKGRKPTKNKYDLESIPDEDLITSRIIWLDDIDPKINILSRYIYIHGTPHEEDIGTPASHGCIRMKNDEIINLFESVNLGMPVIILRD